MNVKLKDPRITVQNTTGDSWQVTTQGLLSGVHGLETVEFTVLVPRSEKSLPEVTQESVKRAIFLLQQYLEGPSAQ